MIRMLCPEPESFSKKGLDFVSQFVDLTSRSLTQLEFEKLAPEYDAVLVRFNTKVDKMIIHRHSNIFAIISPTTGLDHIDLDLAKRNKVKLYHLRGQKKFLKEVSSTAELTIGLLLSLVRKIPESFKSVKLGYWKASSYRGNELSGKTLGVIGCGRLGSKVSRVATSLGMKVIAYDPYISRYPSGVIPKNTLVELLNKSDILTLHVPLSSETKHMIGSKEISLMKDNAILINTSRGSIIETNSLLEGLKSGKIRAAALDVLEREHEIGIYNHPLIDYALENNNLIITPHIGGATFESVEKTDLFILKKFIKDL
jgi:D-3-phosphoglycerate dehydrogenase